MKAMKKVIATLLTSLFLSAVIIGNGTVFAKAADALDESGEIAQTGEGKTIGVSSLHLQNEFNNYVSTAIKEYLEARGYTVNHTNAMAETAQQVKDIENFVAAGVDGIIIAGGEAGAFKQSVSKAKEAGIPVVGVDMNLEDGICGIQADNYSAGAAMGMFLVQQMGGEGKVVVLTYPGWESILARDDVSQEIWRHYNIEVVNSYEIGGEDPIGDSYSVVKSVLQSHPDLKGVYCGWGQPTIGAMQAIQEAGLTEQVSIVGADCDTNILAAMKEEDAPMWAQMGQDPTLMGKRAAYAMNLYFEEGPEAVPHSMYGPTYICTNGDAATDLSVLEYNDMDTQWEKCFPGMDKPW